MLLDVGHNNHDDNNPAKTNMYVDEINPFGKTFFLFSF